MSGHKEKTNNTFLCEIDENKALEFINIRDLTGYDGLSFIHHIPHTYKMWNRYI